VVVFRVYGVARFPKDDFPTTLVYGPNTRAELRLITCGGAFDRNAHSYLDDTVVVADMVAWHRTTGPARTTGPPRATGPARG
jgi:hypothetical protein